MFFCLKAKCPSKEFLYFNVFFSSSIPQLNWDDFFGTLKGDFLNKIKKKRIMEQNDGTSHKEDLEALKKELTQLRDLMKQTNKNKEEINNCKQKITDLSTKISHLAETGLSNLTPKKLELENLVNSKLTNFSNHLHSFLSVIPKSEEENREGEQRNGGESISDKALNTFCFNCYLALSELEKALEKMRKQLKKTEKEKKKGVKGEGSTTSSSSSSSSSSWLAKIALRTKKEGGEDNLNSVEDSSNSFISPRESVGNEIRKRSSVKYHHFVP